MLEYLSSNSMIAYPFREDAPGLTNGSPLIPNDLIVDAGFEVDSAFISRAEVLLLTGVTRISATALDIVVSGYGQYAEFHILAETTINAYNQAITPWVLAAGSLSSPSMSGKIVLGREALVRYLATLSDGQHISFSDQLPLEASTQDIATPGVTDFALYNNGPLKPPSMTGISGDVVIGAGYNIAVVQEDKAVGDISQITLSATPGAGLGQLPCTDTPATGNVPPGLSSVNGNISLQPGSDTCYSIVPYPQAGILMVQGRCQACCTCDDYTRYLEYLKGLCDRIRATKTELDTSHDMYQDGVTKYNKSIAPKYMNVNLALNCARGPDYFDGGSGAPTRLRVIATFTNLKNKPVNITNWNITFNHVCEVLQAFYTYAGVSIPVGIGGTLPTTAPGSRMVVTIFVQTTTGDYYPIPPPLGWFPHWDIHMTGSATVTDNSEPTQYLDQISTVL